MKENIINSSVLAITVALALYNPVAIMVRLKMRLYYEIILIYIYYGIKFNLINIIIIK